MNTLDFQAFFGPYKAKTCEWYVNGTNTMCGSSEVKHGTAYCNECHSLAYRKEKNKNAERIFDSIADEELKSLPEVKLTEETS